MIDKLIIQFKIISIVIKLAITLIVVSDKQIMTQCVGWNTATISERWSTHIEQLLCESFNNKI